MKPIHYIGLMSGTSCDGIDVAITAIDRNVKLIATHFEPFSNTLRNSILALCHPGENAIARMGQCDHQLGEHFAAAVNHCLDKHKIATNCVRAIGCHGQTIRHQPNGPNPFSLQIGNPNIIACRTGIDTITDFRRRDIALGGQGAPLMPAFHAALIPASQRPAWVVNIGGFANVTQLTNDGNQLQISGYDTGPGNALLDWHYQQHHNDHFDHSGEWASSGQINQALLDIMLADPYFALFAPKSTGREYFNPLWLGQQLEQLGSAILPNDLQRTLLELTAVTIAQAIANSTAPVWVCGGGAHNQCLMHRLSELINGRVADTSELGITPDWIEATGFAWLAHQTVNRQPGNLPAVTGASQPAILGATWPA